MSKIHFTVMCRLVYILSCTNFYTFLRHMKYITVVFLLFLITSIYNSCYNKILKIINLNLCPQHTHPTLHCAISFVLCKTDCSTKHHFFFSQQQNMYTVFNSTIKINLYNLHMMRLNIMLKFIFFPTIFMAHKQVKKKSSIES